MIKYITVFIYCLIFIVGCYGSSTAEQREKLAARSKADIVIGFAWPKDTKWRNLERGVDMATDQINASGGIQGRKLVVIKKDDHDSVNDGMVIAQEFANNLSVLAVIGHVSSYISLPTSSTYESAGIVMISPGSTSTRLTDQGFNFVFRTIPSNEQMGTYLAEYAAKKGYKRIVIYYIRNEYGRDLANYFEKRAQEIGVDVIDRRSFLQQIGYYYDVLEDWRDLHDFNALFLAGSLYEGSLIIKQAREIGLNVPIFAGDSLDDPMLLKIAGPAAENIVVISFFNSADPRPMVQQFIKSYQQKYGTMPDPAAALGYDSIKVLAYTMSQAHPITPKNIAKILHNTKNWEGVTGFFTFSGSGELINPKIIRKIVRNGKFEYDTP